MPLLPAPTSNLSAYLPAGIHALADRVPAETVRARRASVLLSLLLGDVFTNDELAGSTRAELL